MLSGECIWMNIERCTPPRLTVGPSILNLKCALHRMNMGDEHHWWCQRISVHDLIWQAERNPWRRTLSLQQRTFHCKLWDVCLDDWMISMKTGDNITWRVLFRLEASLWMIDNRDGVGTMRTINERTILRIIQRMNDRLRSSWWIKQHHTRGQSQAW